MSECNVKSAEHLGAKPKKDKVSGSELPTIWYLDRHRMGSDFDLIDGRTQPNRMPTTCRRRPSQRAWCVEAVIIIIIIIIVFNRVLRNMASLNVKGGALRFNNLLVVIKQTAFEEYSQVGTTIPPLLNVIFSLLQDCKLSMLLLLSTILCLPLWFYCRSRNSLFLPSPLDTIVKITRSSPQSVALEAIGTALQGPQTMCDGFVVHFASISSQL